MKAEKTDKIIAVLIILAVFILGALNLDNNCDWGDDYAAYMTDGIALACGRYDDQIRINSLLRNGFAGEGEVHVHSWGFPLLIGIVERISGFDSYGFGNLYLFKLPSLVFFAIMAGIFFLLLRRSFSASLSLFLCAVLSTSVYFYQSIRNLGNDVLFLSVSVICIYLNELRHSDNTHRLLTAIVLGLALWYAYSVRLNGIGILLTVLISDVFYYVKNRKRISAGALLPYVCFLFLYIIINRIVLPIPTSTSSLLNDFSFSALSEGLLYYADILNGWTASVCDCLILAPLRFVLAFLFPGKDPITFYRLLSAVLCLLFWLISLAGLVYGTSCQNGHIAVYVLFSFFGTAALNLGQGLRYLFPLLPFILMYFGFGISFLCELVHLKGKRRRFIPLVCSLAACLLLSVPLVKADIENLRHNDREPITAYSSDAVEIYRFISGNVPEDCIIAFFKPRALYLNTGRLSMLPGRNGFKVEYADYYLYYKPDPDCLIDEDDALRYKEVFQNGEFILFENLNKLNWEY